MAHKFDVSAREKLNSAERTRLLASEQTLLRLGLKNGDVFADIGCGTGLFTIPAAKLTQNTVYAVDISPEMLNEVTASAQSENLTNIVPVQSDEYDCRLAPQCADFVLFCTVLHEVDDKPRMLAQAVKACKTGGNIAVIEFNETNTSFGPPLAHRLPRQTVRQLFTEAGLCDMEEFKISEAFYAITGKKRA